MAVVPTLTDSVVTLRAHHDDDIPRCIEQSNDEASRRWTRVPVPYTRDDAARFVRHAMPGGWVTGAEWGFAVEAVDDDGNRQYAGTVSLRPQLPGEGDGRAEIAYGAHPWARGRGIFERALGLLLDWGFAEQGLQMVFWQAHVGNWASRKLAWRLGFSFDGAARDWVVHRGELVDGWFGTLLRDDVRLPRNAWHVPPVLRSERAVLRPMRDDDLPQLVEGCSDEQTSFWIASIPVPFAESDAAAFMAERRDAMARGTVVHWTIADPVTDLLIGSTSLFNLDPGTRGEIGYWAHPAGRGRGVMTEAVRLLLRHAFIDTAEGGLGLPKVRLVAAEDNAGSRAVAERTGFRYVGIERAATPCRDGLHDAALYDVVPADVLAALGPGM
ncbi:MAG TPA: GNAT family N-acetyltransferase [Marmoricola sp.]|jgi:RimJ/RimL family protein N-acetyltransferase|nr:GNAT family N-acetyltransferase [Marmoricola sp.]